MYTNNKQNFQESTTILNACTKSLETYWRHHVHMGMCVREREREFVSEYVFT